MFSCLSKLTAITCLSLASISANATTYNVNEVFTGSFSETDFGFGEFSSIHNLYFESLISGDASLFSVSHNTYINGFNDGSNESLCRYCITDETLINGDSIFSTFTFTGTLYSYEDKYRYSTGDYTITGGTGLFSNATGGGSFTALDSYVYGIDENADYRHGTSLLYNSGSITTPDVSAVPIPAAAWLFGSGIMSFFGLRRKNLA